MASVKASAGMDSAGRLEELVGRPPCRRTGQMALWCSHLARLFRNSELNSGLPRVPHVLVNMEGQSSRL
jgi:hypothetical protein